MKSSEEQMNFKSSKAFPVTVWLLTFAAGITCSTLAHYAEVWIVAYGVAVIFAVFASLAAYLVAGE